MKCWWCLFLSSVQEHHEIRLAALLEQVDCLIPFFGLLRSINNPLPFIVIKANFFTHPPDRSQRFGLQPELSGVQNFTEPTWLDKSEYLKVHFECLLDCVHLIYPCSCVVLSVTSLSYVWQRIYELHSRHIGFFPKREKEIFWIWGINFKTLSPIR